jgi:hypothetical protein
MPDSDEYARNKADIARHHQLSVAIPFPEDLDWSPEQVERSLTRLYQYAVDLGISVRDWYMQRRTSKKRWSVGLRYGSYLFAVLGVAFPLIKLFNIESLKDIFGPKVVDLDNIAVEVALALLAIAGGLHAFDRLTGASSAWRRYITAAIGVSDRLQDFQFEWNFLAAEGTFVVKNESPPPGTMPDAGVTLTAPGRRYDLIRRFCAEVYVMVRDETSVWSTEVANALDQFEKHLASVPGHRPPSR